MKPVLLLLLCGQRHPEQKCDRRCSRYLYSEVRITLEQDFLMRIENNYSPLQISGKIIVELRRVRSQLDGGPGLMNHRRGQDRNVRERQGEGVGACAWILFFFFLSSFQRTTIVSMGRG